MNITNITVNYSYTPPWLYHSPGGQTLPIVPGTTTDATVITQLMTSFFWFEILFYGFILFLLIAQLIIDRRFKKYPELEKQYGWLHHMFNEMAGMSLIFITVVNIGIWIWRMNNW